MQEKDSATADRTNPGMRTVGGVSGEGGRAGSEGTKPENIGITERRTVLGFIVMIAVALLLLVIIRFAIL